MKYFVSTLRHLFYPVLEINDRIILKPYCIFFYKFMCVCVYENIQYRYKCNQINM